jgi:hypothetical protein
MSLRMRDFRCDHCGETWEEIREATAPDPKHCGSRAVRIYVSAPGIHYRRRYSHALGRPVSSYREEEKALYQKDGSWIASKSEANDAAQADHFDAPVSVKKVSKERTRKKVEEAAQKLVADGRISFPS